MRETIIILKNDSDIIGAERKLIDAGMDARITNAPDYIKPGNSVCLAVNSNDAGKARLLLGDIVRQMIAADLPYSQ